MSVNQTGKSLKVNFVTSDPQGDLKQLSHILLNLRHHTRLWNRYYGGAHRTNKVNWEKRADEWLQKHCENPDDIPRIEEED
jgi:hypothetical protein